MDLAPRQFTDRDSEFLAMTARWCLREFERSHLLRTQTNKEIKASETFPIFNQYQQGLEAVPKIDSYNLPTSSSNSTKAIKLRLLGQLTQELRTPLTSVIGMASVLRREVYGPLNDKQKEYLDIIHNSGQQLISLVEEIVTLKVSDESTSKLHLSSVDIEMLCQQAINSLEQIAQQQQQKLVLSVEPGNRVWLLDKEKVRQALYYLVISIIESSEAGSEVRIHVSRKSKVLNVAVWVSHPWLGHGLPHVELYHPLINSLLPLGLETDTSGNESEFGSSILNDQTLTSSALLAALDKANYPNKKSVEKNSREILGLLFSCHLAEVHGGKITIQGSPNSGYRYILKLPKVSAAEG